MAGPLSGLTVVVTRPRTKAHTLAAPLEALGARVLVRPALAVAPPTDPGPLREAVDRLDAWDWVAFTSANGVRAVERERASRGGATPPPRRIAVVGPATAAACRRAGWSPDLVPAASTARGLVEAFDRAGIELEGAAVLLPLAEAARDELERGLARRGARVHRVVAYRSEAPDEEEDGAEVARPAAGEAADLVTFTSPSTARNFLEAEGEDAVRIPAAAIGPVTADAARELGFDVVAVADEQSMDGLVSAVGRWAEARAPGSPPGEGGGGGPAGPDR